MTTMHLTLISRRLLLAGVPGLALAGCSGLLGPSEAPKLYVLKPKLAVAGADAKVPWALSIASPDANAGLDSERIAIVRPPARLDYYADAAWSDRLPALLQDVLLEAFEASGRIDAVSRDTNGAHADYILAVDVRDFEARYDQPDGAPVAVVRLDVKLLSALKRDIVARFDAAEEVPATQNSVDAAVEALDAALTNALTKIVAWALDPPRKA